jgi:hypothetical protein
VEVGDPEPERPGAVVRAAHFAAGNDSMSDG